MTLSSGQSTPHDARSAVVREALRAVLDDPARPGLDVVDIGGGTGGLAVLVAAAGHRVTVVDPSPDALASLARRAREREVVVEGRQGDLSTLLDAVGPASADVVLCHGVLEMVADTGAALAAIGEVLRPGGTLSLLVAQRSAAVIARAMAGHFDQARGLLDDTTPEPRSGGRSFRRFSLTEISTAVTAAGFEISATHGVRVFADLVPGSLLDLEPGATTALAELEHAVSQRVDYVPLAGQLHLTAQR